MHSPTKPRHLPARVAEETYVIQDTQGEGTASVAVHLNAMLIRGSEPIVVDTGSPRNAERYLEDLFGLVEPVDVRWVTAGASEATTPRSSGPARWSRQHLPSASWPACRDWLSSWLRSVRDPYRHRQECGHVQRIGPVGPVNGVNPGR